MRRTIAVAIKILVKIKACLKAVLGSACLEYIKTHVNLRKKEKNL